MKQTFFGGKHGFDFICLDAKGVIQCSGKRADLMRYAKENNWAVAKLIPVRFAKANTGGR